MVRGMSRFTLISHEDCVTEGMILSLRLLHDQLHAAVYGYQYARLLLLGPAVGTSFWMVSQSAFFSSVVVLAFCAHFRAKTGDFEVSAAFNAPTGFTVVAWPPVERSAFDSIHRSSVLI